jgi:hypothetical protein
MPLELEKEIMCEIGLGRHYQWHHGSGSCEYTRKQAVEKLPGVIQKYHDEGKEIDLPNEGLIATLKLIAEKGDESRFTLRKTWEATSNVIRAHMKYFHELESSKPEKYKKIDDYLREQFLPPQHRGSSLSQS